MNPENYIEALRFELAGVIRSGDEVAQKAVQAELDRVMGVTPLETAVAPATAETRSE